MRKMEGAEKSKKVKKEKRSVKKTKAVEEPAAETPSAPIAEAEPVVKPKSKAKSTEKEAAPLETEKKAAPPEKVQEPTFEEIQLQAYFIAERRARLGVPGDAASDWVEAEAVLKAQLTSK
jgi:hypothetical protein